MAVGLATKVVIAARKIATVENGPAIAITVGAVGGAVGFGWLAKEAYHRLTS